MNFKNDVSYLNNFSLLLVLLVFFYQGSLHSTEKSVPTKARFIQIAPEMFPSHWSETDRLAFSIGFSISSAFEGDDIWAKVAGNSDGQGVSIGVLQFNLGSGTLQEIIKELLIKYPNILKEYFGERGSKNLMFMMDMWNNFDLNGQQIKAGDNNRAVLPRNAESVEWSKSVMFRQNDRSNSWNTFWRPRFISLSKDQRFQIAQMKAAMDLHRTVLYWMREYKAESLSSYVFFFDMAVQNGSIAVIETYRKLLETPKYENLSEKQRMELILDLRVQKIENEKFARDTRKRKLTALNGHGVVHEKSYNFPKSFLIDHWDMPIYKFESP